MDHVHDARGGGVTCGGCGFSVVVVGQVGQRGGGGCGLGVDTERMALTHIYVYIYIHFFYCRTLRLFGNP